MLYTVVWLCLVGAGAASKVLVVFPVPDRPHSDLGDALVRTLLAGGHEVTCYFIDMLYCGVVVPRRRGRSQQGAGAVPGAGLRAQRLGERAGEDAAGWRA